MSHKVAAHIIRQYSKSILSPIDKSSNFIILTGEYIKRVAREHSFHSLALDLTLCENLGLYLGLKNRKVSIWSIAYFKNNLNWPNNSYRIYRKRLYWMSQTSYPGNNIHTLQCSESNTITVYPPLRLLYPYRSLLAATGYVRVNDLWTLRYCQSITMWQEILCQIASIVPRLFIHIFGPVFLWFCGPKFSVVHLTPSKRTFFLTCSNALLKLNKSCFKVRSV